MGHHTPIFIISPPRSGSTMLQRMLASHTQIATHPEPHIITPLAYLGYYNTVTQAPYDAVNSAQALREFVEALPRQEEDYLDALRAYTDTLYNRVLGALGKEYFVDKTPAYALVLPFLVKLYPNAKYIVLTRHPAAVLHSVAHSFFAGDYAQAEAANPIAQRYVPAIGRFLLEAPLPMVHVRYEDLVSTPHTEMQQLCAYIGVDFEPQAIEYGAHVHIAKSFGDPVGVQRHCRPVNTSLHTWAQDLQARPDALKRVQRALAGLDPAHLEAWGYPAEQLFACLNTTAKVATRRPFLDRYQIERRLLLAARRHMGRFGLACAVRRVRYACDVLLRP